VRIYSVADFFSGCGGFSLGFEQSGSFRTTLAVDHSESALQTLSSNLSATDVRRLDLSNDEVQNDIADRYSDAFDVILGGPPCQGFSTLGKRRDGDERSTLVDQFANLAVRLRPKVIIVENVRGILTKKHPSGGTFASALRHTLTTNELCKYECSEQVLNAAEFGVPQTRVRWFLLAIRQDFAAAKAASRAFWKAVGLRRVPVANTLRDAIGDLPPATKQGLDSCPANHARMNHSPNLVARFKHVPPGGGLLDVPRDLLTPHLKRMIDGAYGSGGHVKNIYGRMEWDKPSGTIVAGMDKITCGRFVHPTEHRLLTPRECARIQTFPDFFVFSGGQVSQYYQIGNAVAPRLSTILAIAAANSLEMLHGPTKSLAA
jgi:DNA (cytosine-5)-methyltransferase 1